MRRALFVFFVFATLLGLVRYAHGACEAPIAQAARDALRTGDFSLVVVWVEPSDEPVLRAAFERARAMRAMWSGADATFVATAEQLHRLRIDATCDREAAIVAALQTGDDEAIVDAIIAPLRAGLRVRLREIAARRGHRRGDIEAGRTATAGYVELVRYVEAVIRAASVKPPHPVAPVRHEP